MEWRSTTREEAEEIFSLEVVWNVRTMSERSSWRKLHISDDEIVNKKLNGANGRRMCGGMSAMVEEGEGAVGMKGERTGGEGMPSSFHAVGIS